MSKYFAKGVESSSDYLLRKKCRMISPPCSILDGTTSFCCEQKEKDSCKSVLYPYGNYFEYRGSKSGMQPCSYKQTKPRCDQRHCEPHCDPCPLYQKSETITICTNPLLNPCNLCKK